MKYVAVAMMISAMVANKRRFMENDGLWLWLPKNIG